MTSAITLAIVYNLDTYSLLRTATVTSSKHADHLTLHSKYPNFGPNR